jgi:hypothetical protein
VTDFLPADQDCLVSPKWQPFRLARNDRFGTRYRVHIEQRQREDHLIGRSVLLPDYDPPFPYDNTFDMYQCGPE